MQDERLHVLKSVEAFNFESYIWQEPPVNNVKMSNLFCQINVDMNNLD